MRTKDIYITSILALLSIVGSAQSPEPPIGPGGAGAPPPPPGLPIDSNLLLLAGAGLLLGIYKMILASKTKKTQSEA